MNIPRSVALERLGYTLAAPILAIAPNVAPHGDLNTAVLAAGAAGTVGAVLAAKGGEGIGRKIMRLSPLLSATAADLINEITPGWCGGLDLLLVTGWATIGWHVLPLSRSARRNHRPAIAHTPTPQLAPAATAPAPAPSVYAPPADALTGQVRQLWERAGNPGRTIVVHAEPHPGMPHDLTLLLRAAETGRPITGLTEDAVAAALGIEAIHVRLAAVAPQPGRQSGPGWLEAHVTPDANARRRAKPTDTEWWADRIAAERGAIPGSTFVDRRRNDERGVTYWVGRMGESHPDVNVVALCRALNARDKNLNVSYDDGRVFVTVDGADILVSVWDASPLAKVYPATRELLTPDAEGRWVAGFLANGQPARNRVVTDRGAAHGLIVAPSGGGKTQLIALFVCADANYGAVVWLAAEAVDEKTAVLGKQVDRQGFGALYMVRLLRAAVALMDIRAEMPWADGSRHDWEPGATGCPYSPLSLYLDEFLTAARDKEYGAEIMDLAEKISVKGRKYGVGEKPAGQGADVQDGFTTLLKASLRELSIPMVLKLDPRKVTLTFKSLGVADEHIPDPLPRSFSKQAAGRLDRIMAGEPEPPADSNTGGVGWIIEHTRPEVLRTLFMDFSQDIAPLFPEQITRLTDHEIRELDKRGLWGDWNRPDDEDGPDLDDFGDEPSSRSDRPNLTKRRDTVTSPRDALAAIKTLAKA